MMSPDDRHKALIGEIRDRLVSLGVPACCFDADSYARCFMTPSFLAKQLRFFRSVPDEYMLEKVFAIGIRDHRFPAVAALTPAVFYSFLAYLRSTAGQTEMKDLATQEKLARKRRRLEARVAELESPVRTAEAEMEQRRRVLEVKPFPVGSDVEASTDPDGITGDLVPEAYDEFNGVVRPQEAP